MRVFRFFLFVFSLVIIPSEQRFGSITRIIGGITRGVSGTSRSAGSSASSISRISNTATSTSGRIPNAGSATAKPLRPGAKPNNNNAYTYGFLPSAVGGLLFSGADPYASINSLFRDQSNPTTNQRPIIPFEAASTPLDKHNSSLIVIEGTRRVYKLNYHNKSSFKIEPLHQLPQRTLCATELEEGILLILGEGGDFFVTDSKQIGLTTRFLDFPPLYNCKLEKNYFTINATIYSLYGKVSKLSIPLLDFSI